FLVMSLSYHISTRLYKKKEIVYTLLATIFFRGKQWNNEKSTALTFLRKNRERPKGLQKKNDKSKPPFAGNISTASKEAFVCSLTTPILWTKKRTNESLRSCNNRKTQNRIGKA